MEKRIIKKLLAIFLIITLLATDFFVLGSGLITYASETSPKVEIDIYFQDASDNKIYQIDESILVEELELYAEIKVNEGNYLKNGATIQFENGNFNIISTDKGELNENKITLKEIINGNKIIKLGIEPIISDKMPANMSLKEKIKLTGTYVDEENVENEEGTSLEVSSNEISVNYKVPETAEAELYTKIITNDILEITTGNKKILQLLVQSRLKDNQYPVEKTTLEVTIPEIEGATLSNVEVLAINNRTATPTFSNDNEKITITLENKADENGTITWNKKGYDEAVVTLLYEEETEAVTVDESEIKITTNAKIKAYNKDGEYEAGPSDATIKTELNNTVMSIPEITTEIYKGKLYANLTSTQKQNIPYETKTTLVVTNIDVASGAVIKEGPDQFVLNDETTLGANAKYLSIEIDKEKMKEILGEEGKVTVNAGGEPIVLSQSTETKITYETPVEELEITTTSPVAQGILEIKHTKQITENSYSLEQLQAIKELKTTSAVASATEVRVELEETITKAELTVGEGNTLSSETTRDINLGITLVTNGEKYDLYNSPVIQIELPEVVESIAFNTAPVLQNVNENDDIAIQGYNADKNIITLTLAGSQKSYPGATMSQLYIPLDLNVKVSKLASSQLGIIKMTTTNTCGKITKTDIVENTINVEAPTELIKWFNFNENTSRDEDMKQQITAKDAGKALDFGITVLNNTETDMNNVRILGKLPTITTLTSIAGSNIYYTENAEATDNIENTANGWSTEFNANAKLYLIKLDTLAKGTYYETTINTKLPSEIVTGQVSETQYEVIYDTNSETDISDISRTITLETYVGPDVTAELTAQVGQEGVNKGETVKEGEVIKYTVTVTNHTMQDMENVVVKAIIPKGTTKVNFEQLSEDERREEALIDKIREQAIEEEITEITENIAKLGAEPYVIEYEVKVNKNAEVTEITHKVDVTYNENTTSSNELKNPKETANISITLERVDQEPNYVTESSAWYRMYVQNMSNETIKNLKIRIDSNTFVPQYLRRDVEYEEIAEYIEIDELNANATITYKIIGQMAENVTTNIISLTAIDKNNTEYRSNAIIEELKKIGATFEMASNPGIGSQISTGETVTYNIKVTNTGETGSEIRVNYDIPEILEIESISINGKNFLQTTDSSKETYITDISNTNMNSLEVEPGKTGTLEIKTKVKEISFEQSGTKITSFVTIEMNGIKQDTLKGITHILKSNSTAEEGLKNIITGLVWLDANGNGQKDGNETVLPNVNVNLYDVSINEYCAETTTNENGEYRFTKIPNGEYIVVFECDNEKYEITTNNEQAEITLNGEKVTVIGSQLYVEDNVSDVNLGLQVKETNTPGEDGGDQGSNVETKQISGLAWLDANRNGQKDASETELLGIKVKIYDVSANDYLKDKDGKIIETKTNASGEYVFKNIEKGSYIILFEYDTEEYEPTRYLADGVDTEINSKVVLKKINLDGEEKLLAVTDTINVQENISNINIGLKEKLIFDLELNKYISRIVVQNNKGTKVYDHEDKTFAKVEIHRKQIKDSLVILEYTIKVKNNGEMSGYVKNIVDYLPSGLTFSSELNTDWYLSENYLYTKCLENVELQPGEEKEIKLILTKTMTNENAGLINNRAEIYQDYNKYGDIDIDSTPNNQIQDEDDIGSVDVIIGVSTGGSITAYIILLMINIILIGIAIRLMIQNKIINIPTRKERG